MRMSTFHFIFVLFGIGLMILAGIFRFSPNGIELGIRCAELGRIDSIYIVGSYILLFFVGYYFKDIWGKKT